LTPDDLVGINIDNPPIEINHCDCQLWDEDGSAYRLVCPKCKQGVLGVRRDDSTLDLLAEDRCFLCGQMFIYKDIERLRHLDTKGNDGCLTVWEKE